MLLPETQELIKKALNNELKTTISSEDLLKTQGHIKAYFEGIVERVLDKGPTKILNINGFDVYVNNFDLPIFIGDKVKFRNFYHKNGTIWVDTEFMIIKRAKPTYKLSEGYIYLIKGKVYKNKLVINDISVEVEGINLSEFEGKDLVIERVLFKNNKLKILASTNIYVVKK